MSYSYFYHYGWLVTWVIATYTIYFFWIQNRYKYIYHQSGHSNWPGYTDSEKRPLFIKAIFQLLLLSVLYGFATALALGFLIDTFFGTATSSPGMCGEFAGNQYCDDSSLPN